MNDIYLNLEKLDPLNTDHANFKNPNFGVADPKTGVVDDKFWSKGYCFDQNNDPIALQDDCWMEQVSSRNSKIKKCIIILQCR